VRKKAKAKLEELGVGSKGLSSEATVADFWKNTYQPYVKQNWAPSTLHSYEDLYERFIEPRFGKSALGEVRTHQLTEFLTGVAHVGNHSTDPKRLASKVTWWILGLATFCRHGTT
jgi:hypothetical protein